ncbi:MAG: serine protease, partial [Chloroflexota bacterium]
VTEFGDLLRFKVAKQQVREGFRSILTKDRNETMLIDFLPDGIVDIVINNSGSKAISLMCNETPETCESYQAKYLETITKAAEICALNQPGAPNQTHNDLQLPIGFDDEKSEALHERHRNLFPSVAMLISNDTSGCSAFFVAQSVLATAGHCAPENETNITVVYPSDNTWPIENFYVTEGRVVYRNFEEGGWPPGKDHAIITINPNARHSSLTLSQSDEKQEGLIILGHPYQWGWQLMATEEPAFLRYDDNFSWVFGDGVTFEGASGAPAISDSGEAVGVLSSIVGGSMAARRTGVFMDRPVSIFQYSSQLAAQLPTITADDFPQNNEVKICEVDHLDVLTPFGKKRIMAPSKERCTPVDFTTTLPE